MLPHDHNKQKWLNLMLMYTFCSTPTDQSRGATPMQAKWIKLDLGAVVENKHLTIDRCVVQSFSWAFVT